MELVIERKGDAEAYVTRSGGGPVSQARIGITLDGYSAPLTAGNFAANVQDGVYDGKPVNASYASVLAGRGAIPGAPACMTHWHLLLPLFLHGSATAVMMLSLHRDTLHISHRLHALSLSVYCWSKEEVDGKPEYSSVQSPPPCREGAAPGDPPTGRV